jgi:malate dehydrogenase
MEKIGIIGAGQVGASLAFLTLLKKLADVALIDVQEGLAEGKALDMTQAGALLGFDSTVTGGGGFRALEGCGITVITAGLARKPGMDRLDLLKKNAEIVSSVTDNMLKYAPESIIILVTNPLDVMTYLAYKKSGFPKNRVMGQAGVLDSARFTCFISQKTGAPPEAVSTFVLGGHGDTMVPLISHTTVSGRPLTEVVSGKELAELVRRTRDGGAEIVSLLKTGSAYYAPAASALAMVEAIINDSGAVMPVSAYLQGEYGLSDICTGVPASLGKNGIKKVIETEITAEEKSMLHRSAKIYRESIAEII